MAGCGRPWALEFVLCQGESRGPGPDRPEAWGGSDARQAVVGGGAGGHLREKRPPQPLGWEQARGGAPAPGSLPALLRVICQCQGAAGCAEAGLRRDTYSGVRWLSLGPGSLGPLCSEGGKATEGFCQLGQGRPRSWSWLRSVARRGPGAC